MRNGRSGVRADGYLYPKATVTFLAKVPPAHFHTGTPSFDHGKTALQGTAKLEGLYTRARKRGAIVLKQFDKSLVDAKATAEIEESSCQKLLPTHFVVTDNVDHLLSTTMLAQTLGFGFLTSSSSRPFCAIRFANDKELETTLFTW